MPTKGATKKINKLGDEITKIFHVVGLFVIGCTIVWSAVSEYWIIMQHESGYASLKDILLLFIYLELGAMISIYYKTHRLPVIFLIFIAITAITRFMVIDMKSLVVTDKYNLLFLVVSILILAISAGILRYTEIKYENTDEKL